MASMGYVDLSQVKEFRDKLAKAGNEKVVVKKVADNLAARFLTEVKKVPPHPYKTGWLRKNWKAETRQDSSGYNVVVKNEVEYASYVEYGHRLFVKGVDTGRWVPGRFMMTNAANTVESKAVGIATKVVDDYLKGLQ